MRLRLPPRPTRPARQYAGGPAPLTYPTGGGGRRLETRGPRGRLLPILAVFASVCLIAWLLVLSPMVRIKHIRVDGVTGALEDATRAQVSGARGGPLLLTRMGPIESGIERDQRIADATVVRRYPDTIVVRVTPRMPVIALDNSKGQVELVDIEGVRYTTVTTAPAGVPVVRGAGGVTVGDAAMRVALSVVHSMPEALRARMSALQVSAADAVTFTVGSTTVTWGNAERSEFKAQLVTILLKDKPHTVDVSAPDTPITT